MDTGDLITVFLTAAGLGAVVGMERQVAKDDTTAGARTFALYSIWGAGAGYFGEQFGPAGFVVAAGVFGVLVVASYVAGSLRQEGAWGSTTEAAELAVFLVGVLVWSDQIVAAVAISVGVTALLRSRIQLHALTDRFSEDDVRAVLQFAVITAVVLPLVPNEDLGPFDAFNPFEIWLMVVFVSGIGLIGYVALRVLGRRGLGLTGVAGGLVSSTAVSLGFSRMSKADTALRPALAAGILAASGIMYPRVLVEASVIAPDLARRLAIPLMVLFVLVAVVAAVWWLRAGRNPAGESDVDVSNPLTLTAALQFGALYGAIVFFSKMLLDRVSEASLPIVGAVSGINDVDAITLSTANLVEDGLDVATASRVVLAAVIVNTAVKAGIVAALGTRRLAAAVAIGLGPAVAAGGVIWFLV
jgi:uncharacterized membrane protein (DUF4010 family)